MGLELPIFLMFFHVFWWVGPEGSIFWGGLMIRISTGSALGWEIGWDLLILFFACVRCNNFRK
jgi:hypothetical protein